MKAKYDKWLNRAGLAEIEELAYSFGNKAMAKKMKITVETLNRWRWRHPAINDAIESGRSRNKVVLKPLETVVLRRYYDKRPDLLLWCDGRRAV